MRRQADEYMRREHQSFIPPYVSNFSVFVSYTLTACPSVSEVSPAKLLAVAAPDERLIYNVTVTSHSTRDKPTSKGPHY